MISFCRNLLLLCLAFAALSGRAEPLTPADRAQAPAQTGSTTAGSGSQADPQAARSSFQKLKVVPEVVFPARQYTFLFGIPKDECGATHPFDSIEFLSSSQGELELGGVSLFKDDPCKAAVAGTVAKDPSGKELTIFLRDKSKPTEILGSVPLKVQIAKAPGPLPPGLAPSVDLMWKVLPRKPVADSYGNRVADQYFAIEVTLGNESGYDLQMAALGFEMPYYDCLQKNKAENAAIKYNLQRPQAGGLPYYVDSYYDPCNRRDAGKGGVGPRPRTSIDTALPIDAYPVVRGTVEREQSVGRRALVVNIVKAAGSTMVGIGGFFPDAGAFVKTTGIFNGPFEKDIEAVYPDLTTRHLVSLDNRTLRDGAVIPNNTSVRINVFISREVVMCSQPPAWWRLDHTSRHAYDCVDDDARVPFQREFNPADIRERLGELTLIGRKIQYLERVRVLTSTADLPESNPGPLLAQSTLELSEDATTKVTLSGTNLEGVTIVPSAEDVTPVSQQKVASDGNSVSFDVAVPDEKAGNHVQFTAVSPRGFASVAVTILEAKPEADAPSSAVSAKGAGATVTITGKHFGKATVTSADVQISEKKVSATQIVLTLDTTVWKAGEEHTVLIRNDGGSAEVKLKLP